MVSAYELHGGRQLYAYYGASMFIILSMGLVGNTLTLIVLLHPEHRNKSMTSLMVNLCVAGMDFKRNCRPSLLHFICLFAFRF